MRGETMKLPYIHFYPGDWLRDPVAFCSLAAQGLWLRMMLVMHDNDPYGYLSMNGVAYPPEFLSRRCGTTLEHYTTLLAELESAGVPGRTETGIIYSRRMVRDAKEREKAKRNGRKGGNPQLLQLWTIPTLNPPDKLPLTMTMTKAIREEDCKGEGRPPWMDQEPFLSAWARWVRHRQEIRHPLQPTMMDAQLRKLAKIGPFRAIAAIEHSVTNGWQGIFESKGNSNQPSPRSAVAVAGHEDN